MRERWFERLRSVIADRGRELLGLTAGDKSSDEELLRSLLAGRGEASAIAIARELLSRYENKDAQQKLEFFQLLAMDFGPQDDLIEKTAHQYLSSHDQDDFLALAEAVEPPRQEVFRRLNMSPRGTQALVQMRADLLQAMKRSPVLRMVDADLKHLLSSWFNRGFLKLERIDWKSPADTLEKLINYESVHEIQGWKDLRRRLEDDRRCFAFFHPAVPGEPIIFVEVALTDTMAAEVAPLLDIESPLGDPQTATTAVFYSINNTLAGLRGISFGNFLIKQVLEDLKNELPNLKQFVTLSPIPRFAQALGAVVEERRVDGLDIDKLQSMCDDLAPLLAELTGKDDFRSGLRSFLNTLPDLPHEKCAPLLQRLVLVYLTQAKYKQALYDPVAMFHLANGAILQRINTYANLNENGMQTAYGCMVNYLYDPEQVEANHERFVAGGIINMSRELQKETQRLESA